MQPTQKYKLIHVVVRVNNLKLPRVIFTNRLNSPVELLPQSFREELLDRDVIALREDDCKSGVDVVLERISKELQ